MPNVTHGDFLNACDNLVAAANANPGEPKVEELRLQLEKDTVGAREAQARRNFHKAAAQQASRDLGGYLRSAREIYSRLRHLLIALFGIRAEKLVEFGLRVFRGPQVTTEQKVTRFLEKNKKRPPENGVEPTRAANSQIDSAS
jgi:hypothetical protein